MQNRQKNTIKKDIKTLPLCPGVYFFLGGTGHILYIGKAASLRTRVRSHFAHTSNTSSPLHKQLIAKTEKIGYKETDSEIEALVLEAELIKRRRPKYNILMRDDKNYSFVGITKEPFPRIFTTHQPTSAAAEFIGPFTGARALKQTLRMLREIFPYCTCKRVHAGTCVSSHIGRCSGFCCRKGWGATPAEISAYRRNIRAIKQLLTGKKKRIENLLRSRMKRAAKEKRFEDAAGFRDRLSLLHSILAHAHVLRDWRDLYSTETSSGKALWMLASVLRLTAPPERIEAYDISNIHGNFAVGSLVVFTHGKQDPAAYRRFRIRTVHGSNDTAMMKEVLKRRFAHQEWHPPDLILVDGGKPQLSAAQAALHLLKRNIPTLALAKREEELYYDLRKSPLRLLDAPAPLRHLLQHVRDESHRFAISYYRTLHRKSISGPQR